MLVHEEGRDLDAWQVLVPKLAELGLCIVAFDLSGHGASDDPWDPAHITADLFAVLEFAHSEGARRLYLIGAGAGATAALVAAGELEVEAIVALSPRAELPGVDSEAIRAARAPKLIVVGSEDVAAEREAADVYRRSIGWGLLQSLPTQIQGTKLLESEWTRQVTENTLSFLRDYL